MVDSIIHFSSGYRWVIIPKVLDFAAPELWHAHWLDNDTTQGGALLRIVKEIENFLIIIEAHTLIDNPKEWKLSGWAMPSSDKYHSGIEYAALALECEVLISSEPPLLSAIYPIEGEIAREGDPREMFSENAPEAEYAFGVILESHSRGTYLRYLLLDLEKNIPNFRVNMVREDLHTITGFGDAYGGQWSLELQEHMAQNIYEAEFTFWRRTQGIRKAPLRDNNPTVVSEETQYFSGEIIQTPKIMHFGNCLKGALERYI